jgi:hypothetical protein
VDILNIKELHDDLARRDAARSARA